MRREEIEEPHYITPIPNVSSILAHGIVCHKLARNLSHQSVAMPEIQERRKKVAVPGGQPLHKYVNLYICARNPMLYTRRGQHAALCALRVSTDLLDLAGAVIADGNASSDYTRFRPSPQGLRFIDHEEVFADDWTHREDQIAEWRHKSAKCAEVLVPDCVPPSYITGAYVSCSQARKALTQAAPDIKITLNPKLFFQ